VVFRHPSEAVGEQQDRIDAGLPIEQTTSV
jgi:hypothetical protein